MPHVHSRCSSPSLSTHASLTRLPHGFPMGLFGRKKTSIGLDIGSGLVKVAVIDHSKGEPELTKVAIAPLLADAIVEGEVMDPGIVAEAARNALAAAGIKGRPVITAVGGRDVIIKKIQ